MRNWIAAAVATNRRNNARRIFQMSHNCNVQACSFAATPVAALAGGALHTQRPVRPSVIVPVHEKAVMCLICNTPRRA